LNKVSCSFQKYFKKQKSRRTTCFDNQIRILKEYDTNGLKYNLNLGHIDQKVYVHIEI